MGYFIIKRDGVRQEFNPQKIKDAVLKAFYEVDGEISDYARTKADNIANYIEGYMEGIPNELTIEEIQSLVEHGLMSGKRKDVATAYIEYRHDRDRERKWNSSMMNIMKEKLAASNVANQNANVDEHSFGGRRGEANSVIMKQFALDNCISKKARTRHLNNEIYIHDLDTYAVGMHNCLSVPFDDLLAKGFNTRQTDVRPANSVNTAFQLVAVIFQLQSLMQFGGVSATHLDWTMVPYVRKSFWKHFRDGLKYIENQEWKWDKDFNHIEPEFYSIALPEDGMDIGDTKNQKCGLLNEHMKAYKYAMDMTIKETQQAVEGMFHNLNTLQSRSGNQLPFTSINFGTCTLPEGRMIIKAILEGGIKGVGKFHKTPIFPCTIFQCMRGINRKPGDPNYDLYRLALESTAKRLYPNYANVDWSGNAGYDINDPRTYFSTMGCRTANGFDITIDVSHVGKGEHKIVIYAIDTNDEHVETGIELPFTQEKEETGTQTEPTNPPTSDAMIAVAGAVCATAAGAFITTGVIKKKRTL
jgi:ribonucleoside-triphosphate reductase